MPAKRKRPDRPSGDGGRPSPHRPADTSLAQHDREDGGGRGGGRGRGNRGGFTRRDSNHGHGRNASNYHQNAYTQQSQQAQSTPTPSRTASFSQPPPPSPKQSRPPASPQTTKHPAPPSSAPKHASSPVATRLPSDAGQPPASSAYFYENLTDEKVRTWAERGQQEIVQHGIQSREDVDITELSSLFQEFIHAVVEARLEAADAGACVKAILGEETPDNSKDSDAFAPHTLFLDSLAIVMDNDPDLYRPSLREFLVATGVSTALMREVLDAPLLQQLGLIRDNFARLGVRQATNLLYRQANYNLLREESEGYSKLITELFSTSSVPPPPPGKTFEKVKALIGTFDLDVGRALDVTLDVTAAVLIKQFKFFVKFLRTSSWWPSARVSDGSSFIGGLPVWALPDYPQWNTSEEDDAKNSRLKLERDVAFWDRAREIHLAAFFELGGRRVTERHLQQSQITNGGDGDGAVADAEQAWIRETKTLPALGNRVAAQLLGFKLRFYNSDMRDVNDVLPANLLYLAALLIKIGFLSLTDLYPHLSPADGDMERVREQEATKLEEAEREARGGQMNALLMAGVLPQGDDDNPMASNTSRRELPKKSEPEQKKAAADAADQKKLPEPLEQKVALLTQLLTIGAIPESLFILGRFPWIPEVFPDVLDRIHRILHVSIDKVYADTRPSSGTLAGFPTKNVPDIDQTGVPKGSVRLSRLPGKKVWRWPFPDKFDTNENQNYRYYWDEWADNVPVCQTVDDVFTLCGTFMNLSGVNIGKDEPLLTKLASIGAKSLAVDKSDSNRARWQDLVRRLLLPALSHTKANAAAVSAVWELVKQYPLVTRYAMYAEWFEGSISRLPAMRTAFARSASETKATMKRVSLTNLSEMAKRLAKTSYASPGIVFKVAFEQLEVYSNLIEAFVECAKYFTDLSYDVLVWSLLNSLGKSRSRTQEDHALTTSKWLQALSRFSGKVFKRYSVLNPVPVLQYVDQQLFLGNSTDLIILKEFISVMGGIVASADFTDYQILSLSGGRWLRRHTLIRAQDKRFDIDNVKSSGRLMQALSDSKLATRLLVNLAQYRQVACYKIPDDEAHIKFLSSIVDDSHQALMQYIDFLWSSLEPAAFDAIVPSIPDLMKKFGLQTDLAFLIGRGSLAHRMFPWQPTKEKKDASQARKPVIDKEGDVSMSDAKPQNVATQQTPDVVNEEHQKPDDSSLSRTASIALQPIIEAVQPGVRPEIWQKLTPELYATFWALQLGDLCFPEEIYTKERNRLMSEWSALGKDRSDPSRSMQRNAERRKIMDIQGYLIDELAEHGLRKAKWKFYLTKLFQTSFPDSSVKPDSISDVLLEQCFLPRTLLSPADAEYTYRFVKALHDCNAPTFKLMSLLDRLFNANRLRSLIFTCTVREAENLGRFLKLVLEDLSRWHKNEPVVDEKDSKASKGTVRLGAYDKEGKGPSDQPRLGFVLTVNEQGKPETFVEHAQFRDLLFRWHKNLNTALKTCLGGSEWMHIRNAITVLKAVLDYFPAVDFMATQFTAQLQKISTSEMAKKTTPDSEEGGRVDLSVAAQGAMSELQKRKSRWVMVQAFRSNAPAGPHPDANKGSKLRPDAPDFKPNEAKPASNKMLVTEEEDGEVQDAKDTKGRSGTGTPKESLPVKPSDPSRDSTARRDEASGPSRSSTPRLGPIPGRLDPRAHKLPDRPMHNLPSRPDVPMPGPVPPERYAQRGHDRREGRDPRESRGPREGREPREAWDAREPRPSDPDRLGRPREASDRHGSDGLIDRGDMPPRPVQHRDARGRAQDRHIEPVAQPSGPPPAPSEQLEPAMNPERAALFAQEGADRPDRQPRARRPAANEAMDAVNPDRVPMMEDRSDAHNSQGRLPRDDGRDRGPDRGPRPPSPRRSSRHGPEYGPATGGYDDRPPRPFHQEPRGPGRDPRDRSPLPGGNFRGDRSGGRDAERGAMDQMRDPQAFHRSGPRVQDFEHRMPHQDQNYGRLNPIPSSSDIPSGPRGRGRSTTRGGHGTHSSTPGRLDGRFGAPETPRPPSPDRPPPTGPASARSRPRGYDHGTGPTTPSGPPGGPHSDRMQTFGSENATPSSGVHPDRLAQMGGSSLPPPPPPGPSPHGQTWHGSAGDRHASGPRQAPSDGMGPSPADAGVPTGPASSSDRSRAGGGRRQLAGINTMLQQAQTTPDMGRSSGPRGAPPRQLLGNSDAQVLAGGSPATTPGQERQDTMWQESTNWGPANGGDGSVRRDHRGERESRSDRPSRSSRRSSRERERDRSPRPARESEAKEHSEYRDRRSLGAETGGKERDPRRPGRDIGARDMIGQPPPGGRELMGGWEPRHRPEGLAGNRPGDEWAAGGGSGQRPGRGGPREAGPRDMGNRGAGERREPRDDRGRKRRSEEGAGGLESDREKRPRRG